MSTYFLKIWCALLLLLLYTTAGSIHGYNMATVSEDVKCIEKERQALLSFKLSLLDPYDMLSTWRDDHDSRDCCKWRGVVCGNETGHVLKLRLRGSRSYQSRQFLSGEIFNITSLLELHNMEYFDLSSNYFHRSEIPKHIGSFNNLRYLNLSYSDFGGMIPYQLGNLSQLEYLDLKRNYYLRGEIPSQLGQLTHLRYLDLSVNYGFNGEIPHQLGNLSQLQYLDLGDNFLLGAIPFHVGNLPMLETLRLGWNSGLEINDGEWLSTLSSLTNLDLSSIIGFTHHMISKILPKLRKLWLSGCLLTDNDIRLLFESHSNYSTSLTILDLSYNELTSSTFQLLSNFSYNLQELHLFHNHFTSFPPYLSFPSLVTLDLSDNNLSSSTVFHGNSNFGPKLQVLSLQECDLSDSFLSTSPSIMNSSYSLVDIDLSHNQLTSSAIFHWLFNFTSNLHSLHLDHNLLEGPIPYGFGKKMNNLETLSMSGNKLKGEIPASLGNICTLRDLDLSNNNLSGEMSSLIQNSSWCNRHMLRMMDLSDNRITGLLPDLSIFSSLNHLDLSYNQLNGEIPKSIGLLYELESLCLEGNSLEGDITELHLSNLSKLNELDFSDNSLSLKFDTKWAPPFQLFALGLASCKLGPNFPSWLQNQRPLEFLDISDAGINDSVPVWFWSKLQSIQKMNMSYNNLIGTIPNLQLKLRNHDEMHYILNSNQFQGRVPAFLLQVTTLDLSKNKFSNLNTALCDNSKITEMRTFDLSDNQIMGQLSDCWGHLNSLEFVDLRNNKLSGTIPLSMTTLVNLQALVLRNNSFIGELPSTLQNCSGLSILDVGENLLSGSIPSWIGESFQQLKILSLRENLFFGTLPSHLCYLKHVQVLDLSGNNLSGRIPTCLKNFTAMVDKSMDLNGIVRGRLLSRKVTYYSTYVTNLLLSWKGQEQVFKNPERLLKSIDLSRNHLSGKVPAELGQLLGLVSLNLSSNNLSGEIPSDIGDLNSLEFLDLSRNHFSGEIPETLTLIDRLSVLDLSHNSLSGKIPLGTQLQSFYPSSFEGNLDLCGKPLEKICPENETPSKPQGPATNIEDDNSVFYEALYMSMGIGFFTGFWCLIGPLLIWRSWRNAYLRFLNKMTDYAYH